MKKITLPICNQKIRDGVEIIAEVAIILGLLFVLCWPYEVEGVSMLPGVSPGDRVVMSRLPVWLGRVHRGDLVVAKNPYEPGKRILKRVRSLPGDIVLLEDGTALTLGDDEYFLVGDNEAESVDSRAFGSVRKSDLIGRLVARVYPFNRLRVYL